LRKRYGCDVVGLDRSADMLAAAAARNGHMPLVRGRAESLPFPDGSFDHLTFTYLLRYVEDPGATLAELTRVVRSGGRVASLEFMLPPNPIARALWHAYTRLAMPVVGRLISRDWYEVGRFLGPSISQHYARLSLESQLDLWRAAGVDDVRARVMSFGGGVVIWGTRA
jgi:demethylmenaquinone methyltransferase/2-methoxy-6-polyprenyl-1,4-benzoquinol methylase